MSSIYDKITSTYELLLEVKAHGLSTKQEDICRAQDIVGHEPIKNLIALANDIGRDDHEGNPDPNGSWASGRMATRELMYHVLYNIWSWSDFVDFWNRYSNPDRETITRQKEELAAAHKTIESMSDAGKEKDIYIKLKREKVQQLSDENRHLKNELHDRDMTILELKAELYDLMKKVKGASENGSN